MRYSAMIGAALVMPGIVLERAAASYFISDYEKHRRLYVALLIVSLQWFSTLFLNGIEYLRKHKKIHFVPKIVSTDKCNGFCRSHNDRPRTRYDCSGQLHRRLGVSVCHLTIFKNKAFCETFFNP
jgi:hypothetical protein